MAKEKVSLLGIGNERVNSFEHEVSAMASELSNRYLNKELDSGKFWEEELDLVRKGLYVQGFSLLFTAQYLHLKGKLLGISCTSGGHVVDFRCKKGAYKKAIKMLHSFDDMPIEDLFTALHEEMPAAFSLNS